MNLKELMTDKTLENEGVWIEDIFPGVRVKMRAASYRPFMEFVEHKKKPYALMGKEPTNDEMNAIVSEGMAKHLVLDWDGVEDDEGPVNFSEAVAKKTFLEVERFTARILQESGQMSNFQGKHEAAAVKNSPSTSGGESTSEGASNS